MSIAGNNLTALECGPYVFLDCVIRSVFPDFSLHFTKPNKNFLVGEPVEGTSKAIQRRSKGKERVRESGANKFARMSRDVAAFVVAVRDVFGTLYRNEWGGELHLWIVMYNLKSSTNP